MRVFRNIDGIGNDFYDNHVYFSPVVIILGVISIIGVVAIGISSGIYLNRRVKSRKMQQTERDTSMDELKKYVDWALDKLDKD